MSECIPGAKKNRASAYVWRQLDKSKVKSQIEKVNDSGV